jgi:hypothetical protein
VPDRETLRALYDAAAEEINATRGNYLNTAFYNKTKDAVFNAGHAALSDFHTDTRRMQTVSAPVGGGKTSFSYSLISAVTRYAEQNPDAAYGSVFVTDQIERADEVYRELEALLPGRVAIWTTDHDSKCTKPTKVENPAARFDRDALQHYPVVVVTHQSYLGPKGYKTRNVRRNGRFLQYTRALTIVDEQPAEVDTFEVSLAEAESVREALRETRAETKEHLDNLLRFMHECSYAPANRLIRPGLDVSRETVSSPLAWFATREADLLAKRDIPSIARSILIPAARSARPSSEAT